MRNITIASSGFLPALLFLISSGVSTTASMSARKLSQGPSRSIASSGSPFADSAANRLSASKNPNCPILASANHAITHQIRTTRQQRLFFRGAPKTFDIQIDREKLVAYGLTLPQVLQTLNNSNINVGGNTVNIGQQSAVVRGVGLIRSIADIRNTMLTAANGTPVFLGDIAAIITGNKPRLGIAGRDGEDDIVQGIVLMRRGQQSLPTIQRVKAEVDKINTSSILPPGVRIERIYDRSDLINLTTHTVLFNLIFGMILVFFVQWIFLGDLPSA